MNRDERGLHCPALIVRTDIFYKSGIHGSGR